MFNFQYILFLLSLHVFICQELDSMKHAQFFFEILSQQAFNLFFRAPIIGRLEEQALLSKILQITKSMRFRSGDEGGHHSFG